MAIFDGVQYALASALSNERQRDISNLMNANGAVEVPVQQATHIITPTLGFESARSASEHCVLVSPAWVERSQVLGKMQEPEFFSPDEGKLFSGVHATTSGIHSPDLEIVIASIQALGGQFSVNYTRSTTHLITSTDKSSKYVAAMGHVDETGVKVVVPHWLSDCINIQRRLPEEPYQWPNPICLNGDQITKSSFRLDHDRALLFQSLKMDGLQGLKPPVKEEVPDPQVWRGRKIYLSSSLELDLPSRRSVEEGIKSCNGQVVDSIEDAGILVTRYRGGNDYVSAHGKGLTIGTLQWLKHVERTGVFHSPTDQLLHYPIPSGPIPGFSKHEITITNYTGDARDYLKRLISLMGAKYTATLSPGNTVVVAAYVNGAKTEKAREWSTPIVNHVWLEDCFLEWACLPVGQPKYLYYPIGIDWSVILGNKHLGRVTLEDDGQSEIGVAARLKNRNWIDGRTVTPTKVKVPEEDLHHVVEETMTMEAPPLASALTNQSAADALEVERSLSRDAEDTDEGTETEIPKPSKKVDPNEFVRATSDFDVSDSPVETSRVKDQKGKGKVSIRDVIDVDEDSEDNVLLPPTSPKVVEKSLTKKKASPSKKHKASEDELEQSDVPKSKPENKLSKVKGDRKKVKVLEILDDEPSTSHKLDAKKTSRLKNGKPSKPKKHISDDEEESEPGPSSIRRRSSGKPATSGSDKESPPGTPPPKRAKPVLPPATPLQEISDTDSDDYRILPTDRKPRVKKADRENVPLKEARSPKGKSKAQAKADSEESDGFSAVKTKKPSLSSAKRKPLTEPSQKDKEASEDETPLPPKRSREKSKSKDKGWSTSKSRKTIIPVDLMSVDEDEPKVPRKKPPAKKSKLEDDNGDDDVQIDSNPTNTAASRQNRENKETREDEDGSVVEVKQHNSNTFPASSSHGRHPSAASFGHPTRSPSKRSAAAKAGDKLRDDVKDMNQFVKEMKKGNVRGSWEKGMDLQAAPSKKRPDSRRAGDSDNDDDIIEISTKKRKREEGEKPAASSKKKKQFSQEVEEGTANPENASRKDSKKVKIVTTQVVVDESLQKKLKKLGAAFIEDATKCTHLIVQKIGRTEKFLCAMAVAPHIVTEKWITDSANAGKFLDETPYYINDPTGEAKWNFSLMEALERSKKHRSGFLKGHTFFVSKSAEIDKELLRNIVAAHGGECFTKTFNQRNIIGHFNRHVISSAKDRKLWESLVKAGVKIYVPELIITGVLVQEMDWETHQLKESIS